jgi:hypothetical protein
VARTNAVIKALAKVILLGCLATILLCIGVALATGRSLPAWTAAVVFVACMYMAKVAGYRPISIPWWLSAERPSPRKVGAFGAPVRHHQPDEPPS